MMHPPSASVAIAVLTALMACAATAQNSGRTLKDLPPARVVIQPDEPSDANAGKAMDNYRRFLELQRTDPALRAEAMRRLGDLSLESGELERLESEVNRVDLGGAEAIRLYGLLLRAHPDYARNDQVMYQLARAYETTGQPEQALATLDEVVRKYPSSREIDEVQFRRGELLFSAGRYREAEQAYLQVTRKSSGNFYAQSLYKQGWSMFKQSMLEESLPMFGKLLDLQLLDRNAALGFKPLDRLSRAERELAEDTLRVMSVSFSDLDGVAPLNRYVDSAGRPAYSPLLYSSLGDLYVSKQRYQDGAAAYRAFVGRDANHEMAPNLSMRAIEAYRQGGFAQLVLDGKREYVENYNLGAAFWQGRDRANYPHIVSEIKTNLTDLAAYHHSNAQKTKQADEFAQAARWYRLQLSSFPNDADSAQVNFRLADVLYEGGQFAAAVDEYERSAYTYAPGPDSAKAAYAALSAYEKHAATVTAADRPAWKRRSIESGVKFATSFPDHADGNGVLTRATQDLYTAKDLPRAIEVAEVLLARMPAATPAQRRIGFSVVGQSRFDQSDFAAAESAWMQARNLAVDTPEQAKALNDQLAVAVYRQAEAKRGAGDLGAAVQDFLRIASVAPGTTVVETAQYDAAAALITLKEWPRAIEVLEGYRRDYPNSKQQPDVTQKLAVAYMEAGRADAAAAEFEKVAAVKGQTPELRLEAMSIAAEQHEKSGNTTRTVALLEQLVKDFPTPVPERIETRQRLADFAAKAGQNDRVSFWQREIVKADASAGAARSPRTRFLAARASLALAQPSRDAFRGIRLTTPLRTSLANKRKALDTAMTAYRAAAAYEIAEVTTQASFEMAELYRQLGADLMASDKPKGLSADALEQYDLLLEEQAIPFEEQAIKLHEANAARAREGLYDDGVKASYSALAKLLPARYGKAESLGTYSLQLSLPEAPAPVLSVEPTGSAAPVVAGPPQFPGRIQSQFARANQLAEGGQLTDAELEFKQLLEAAPGASGPAYNLGVLLRNAGRLEEAETAFKMAASRTPRSALPLSEMGNVRRLRGDFAGAVTAYRQAIEADANYAAAYRNLAVVLDVYLADAAAALPPMQRYQELTGEDRPVTGWIADLKQRSGRTEAAPATQERTE